MHLGPNVNLRSLGNCRLDCDERSSHGLQSLPVVLPRLFLLPIPFFNRTTSTMHCRILLVLLSLSLANASTFPLDSTAAAPPTRRFRRATVALASTPTYISNPKYIANPKFAAGLSSASVASVSSASVLSVSRASVASVAANATPTATPGTSLGFTSSGLNLDERHTGQGTCSSPLSSLQILSPSPSSLPHHPSFLLLARTTLPHLSSRTSPRVPNPHRASLTPSHTRFHHRPRRLRQRLERHGLHRRSLVQALRHLSRRRTQPEPQPHLWAEVARDVWGRNDPGGDSGSVCRVRAFPSFFRWRGADSWLQLRGDLERTFARSSGASGRD